MEEGTAEAQLALKDFVYNAIKHFAEQNQRAYQSSNLIDLMNKVVETRRGDIFDDTASISSMTGGNISHRGHGLQDEKSFGMNTQSSSHKFKGTTPKITAGAR